MAVRNGNRGGKRESTNRKAKKEGNAEVKIFRERANLKRFCVKSRRDWFETGAAAPTKKKEEEEEDEEDEERRERSRQKRSNRRQRRGGYKKGKKERVKTQSCQDLGLQTQSRHEGGRRQVETLGHGSKRPQGSPRERGAAQIQSPVHARAQG